MYQLDASVSLEQGAMSVTNPLTAMAFLTLAKEGRHKVIVQTAAAGALGQMVNHLCKNEGIQIINIVRREAQRELLQEQGAEIVLNSSDADFSQHLQDVCQQYQPRLAFDAVAGPLTTQILKAMPHHSKMIVYGGLSHKPTQVRPDQLVFGGKSIEGFWLPRWIRKKNVLQNLVTWRRAQKLIMSDLKSDIRKQYPLSKVQSAIREYQSKMTGGKILLRTEPQKLWLSRN